LNLTHVNRDNRDEVRRLANDELILSGMLHLLTHVKPELMHEIAKALGIVFSNDDSDATIADWIMCVSHNLDPIPGGKLPTLVKGEKSRGSGEDQSGSNKRGASRSARSAGSKKHEESTNDADADDNEDEEEEEKKPAEKKRSSTAKGASSSHRRKASQEEEADDDDEESEEEEKPPEKKRRVSKEEDKEEEEHPVDRGYYTEDGKWVHPPFELVMAKKFDSQGLNNNFNLPDLLEFCKLHDIPVSSSVKKKNAVIRLVLQFVENGSVPNKRKSSGSKKSKTAKKDGSDEEGSDDDNEAESSSPSKNDA